MGFYPQFVDINSDGITDIVSGSYNGDISFYKGSKSGDYEPVKYIKQVTNPRDFTNMEDVIYTNPTFGDFNGDGLLDAFIGGLKGVRVMCNEGTLDNPIFGIRTQLLQINDKPIDLPKLPSKHGDQVDYQTFISYVDWDRDGIKDLITTTSNVSLNSLAISFHKGVKKDSCLVFNVPIALVESFNSKERALPGSSYYLHIGDANDDGILDILIGATVAYNKKHDKVDEVYSYKFMCPKTSNINDINIEFKGVVMILYGK